MIRFISSHLLLYPPPSLSLSPIHTSMSSYSGSLSLSLSPYWWTLITENTFVTLLSVSSDRIDEAAAAVVGEEEEAADAKIVLLLPLGECPSFLVVAEAEWLSYISITASSSPSLVALSPSPISLLVALPIAPCPYHFTSICVDQYSICLSRWFCDKSLHRTTSIYVSLYLSFDFTNRN